MLKQVEWRYVSFALLVFVVAGGSVCAAGERPKSFPECNELSFYDHPHHLGLASVEANRAYFARECVLSNSRVCTTKQYVIKGDNVVVGNESVSYTCARFEDPRSGEVSGLIKSAQLRPINIVSISDRDWIGRWRSYSGEINIERLPGGRLNISGEQLGHEDNTSYLDGQGAPQNVAVTFNSKSDGDRTVGGQYTILNLRRYIIVFHNSKLDQGFSDVFGFGGIYSKGGSKLKEGGGYLPGPESR